MATINEDELYLSAEGASEEQLRRGLAAFRAALAGRGIAVAEAFAALIEREMAFDLGDASLLAETHSARVDAFDAAMDAATEAADQRAGFVEIGLSSDLDEEDAGSACVKAPLADSRQMTLMQEEAS